MNTLSPLVCVVDDDDMVCASICALLSAHGFATRGFGRCDDFLSASLECDCLILDVRLPGISGPELQEQLAAKPFPPPIIFISGHGTVPLAVKTIQLGALDFLQKPFDEDSLIERVNQAVERSLEARRIRDEKSALAVRHAALTRREKEVLDLLAEGLASKQIADRLALSTRTVEQYRGSLKKKLGARSLAGVLKASEAMKEG
jgi:FixJ family two-component response regulator